MSKNEITTWYGQNVEDMTKVELIQALKDMAAIQEQDRKTRLREIRVMRDLAHRQPNKLSEVEVTD